MEVSKNLHIKKIESLEVRLAYAALYKRIGAFCIDLITNYFSIIIILRFTLRIPFKVIFKQGGTGLLFIIFSLFFYFFLTLYFNDGQTYGCKLLKIKTVEIDNSKLTLFHVAMKSIVLSLLACPFVFGWMSVLMAGTYILACISDFFNPHMRKYRQNSFDLVSKTSVIEIG